MIRAGEPADLDAVADLEATCLGRDAWSAGLLAEGLAGRLPTVRYLVAGEPVVGHAVVSLAGEIAELQRIAVAEEHRRAGIASDLLARVLVEGRRSGADRILLEVREDNAGALSFYAAHGFVEIDRRARYYTDGAAAVVMRLGLVKGCG